MSAPVHELGSFIEGTGIAVIHNRHFLSEAQVTNLFKTLNTCRRCQFKTYFLKLTGQLSSCVDSPLCDRLAEICNGDDDNIIKSMCPVKCGFCDITTSSLPSDCQDNPAINCSALAGDVCTSSVAHVLCPRTCNLCDQGNPMTNRQHTCPQKKGGGRHDFLIIQEVNV